MPSGDWLEIHSQSFLLMMSRRLLLVGSWPLHGPSRIPQVGGDLRRRWGLADLAVVLQNRHANRSFDIYYLDLHTIKLEMVENCLINCITDVQLLTDPRLPPVNSSTGEQSPMMQKR